jgi:hypothetical protein
LGEVVKVFLVVIALWRSEQTSPSMVQAMPSMESCQIVAAEILKMSPQNQVRCVVVP